MRRTLAASRPGQAPAWFSAGLFLLLAVCTWIAYTPARDAPFVFDDVVLQADPALAARSAGDVAAVLGRPAEPRRVGYASFALGSWLGARSPGDHRRANLAIHVLNGLLLFLLGRTLLERGAVAHPGLAAGLGALLWALHPVQTQAVTYVCQRFASLATCFYLASMLCLLAGLAPGRRAGPRAGLLLAAAALGALALGTKQNAATLPLFMVLALAWWRPVPLAQGRRWLAAAGALALAGAAWLALGPGWAAVEAGSRLKGFTPLQRVMTEWRVIVHYVTLLAWPDPSRLQLDHDFPLSHGLLTPPGTLAALLAIGAALFAALAFRRREPLLSLYDQEG
jgi:hypothetical protein